MTALTRGASPARTPVASAPCHRNVVGRAVVVVGVVVVAVIWSSSGVFGVSTTLAVHLACGHRRGERTGSLVGAASGPRRSLWRARTRPAEPTYHRHVSIRAAVADRL